MPLIVAGLWFDAPAIAYGSLWFPEAQAALWLWRRLQARPGADAGAGAAQCGLSGLRHGEGRAGPVTRSTVAAPPPNTGAILHRHIDCLICFGPPPSA